MNSVDDIKGLDKEDTYSITLLLLFVFSRNPKYSSLSELAYILDQDNFLKFIKYYEGQTITIPTMNEISKNLKVLMIYQYYVVDKLPWREALVKAGFDETESYSAQRLLYAFRKTIDDYMIGDLFSGKR